MLSVHSVSWIPDFYKVLSHHVKAPHVDVLSLRSSAPLTQMWMQEKASNNVTDNTDVLQSVVVDPALN